MKPFHKLLVAAFSATFFMASAQAQNAGTVTNHGFAIGNGPGVQGFSSLVCGVAQIAIGQTSAHPLCRTVAGDVTLDNSGNILIGSGKVDNSRLATMAANTTKCNATAGTANPTDCAASTMRTNMGVVIGTNVQAWDTDLDCLAALSSTGVISRTGAGTCSAGALALSGLATGTQDTVIGYFGSTTASATAISNCTGALTYSTSTHTFGCNVSAGTGTVTSVTCFGTAITTTGTCTTAASKSSQQTGTSTTDVVTPSQQQSHDSAAKAWVTFQGNNATNLASYNINTITRNSAGIYTITFLTAFSSANYACTITTEIVGNTSDALFAFVSSTSKSTGGLQIRFLNQAASAAVDPVIGHMACYGRQ